MAKNNKPRIKHIVKIGSNEYDYESIVRKTVNAPVIKINVSFFNRCKPTGIADIDSSVLRISKINNQFHVLSGYNKVIEFRTALAAAESKVTDIVEECALNDIPKTIDAVLMSPRYLESTLLPPRVISGDELKSATSALQARFAKP